MLFGVQTVITWLRLVDSGGVVPLWQTPSVSHPYCSSYIPMAYHTCIEVGLIGFWQHCRLITIESYFGSHGLCFALIELFL